MLPVMITPMVFSAAVARPATMNNEIKNRQRM
jgi:hypothetical protein